MATSTVERTTIAGSLEIPRIINGLWQLADRSMNDADLQAASHAMKPLIDLGLNAFDTADHYGDSELVLGTHSKQHPGQITAFTKWCPNDAGPPEAWSFTAAQAAVDRALARLGTPQIALLQYHAWDYASEAYLHNLAHLRHLQRAGKVARVGLTNADAGHLELLLHSGYEIASNQVSASVLDRRLVRGRLSKVCADHGVAVLAYGTLLGGFLGERWLGAREPTEQEARRLGPSLRKYLRFIWAAGGWDVFQGLLKAVHEVAQKHGVSIGAVATRWVLDIPVVKAVIVGTQLDQSSAQKAISAMAAFSFKLDDEDVAKIIQAQEALRDIPGDCGDEYRRPPYLTAAGDLRDHFPPSSDDALVRLSSAIAAKKRIEYHSGTKWELIAGYSRATRVGDRIYVSGTTAHAPSAPHVALPAVGGTCARCQAVSVLDAIDRALGKLGGSMADVVRTRIIVRREEDAEAVSHVHGWRFYCEGVRPANMLIVAGLVGDEFLVEIEAEAVVGFGDKKHVVVIH